jgi:hypothetical protein
VPFGAWASLASDNLRFAFAGDRSDMLLAGDRSNKRPVKGIVAEFWTDDGNHDPLSDEKKDRAANLRE